VSTEPGERPQSAAEAFGLARTLTWWDGFNIALGVPVFLYGLGPVVLLDVVGRERPRPRAPAELRCLSSFTEH
jgi:hypothetical protein